MPALSPTMERGTLARWLVAEGDVVAVGDLLAEIETDKATLEIEAVDQGRITSIVVPEGTEDVDVGSVIALIEDEDAAGAIVQASGAATGPASDGNVSRPLAPAPSTSRTAAPALSEDALEPPRPASLRPSDEIAASPLAFRISEAMGIDLRTVRATGPGGRIVLGDLPIPSPRKREEVAAAPIATQQGGAPEVAPAPPLDVPHQRVRLSTMRRTVASRLAASKREMSRMHLTVEVQMGALLELRARLNDELAPRDIRLSVNDMLVKALALALMEVPECNVRFDDDHVLRFARADLSVAVSIDGGLATPVVRDAARLPLSRISEEMRDLATRARADRLAPEECSGGTASLSNLGMFGIDSFEAVIDPAQGMVMAIGAIVRRPVERDGRLETLSWLSATGSFDHRVIGGGEAARLMNAFRSLVETPMRLLA
nr:dihydrolipoamide acetyltransferase family protein [Sphingomonas corticis]